VADPVYFGGDEYVGLPAVQTGQCLARPCGWSFSPERPGSVGCATWTQPLLDTTAARLSSCSSREMPESAWRPVLTRP
jgi:hypothetical protein